MTALSGISKKGSLFGLFLLIIVACCSQNEDEFYYAVYFEEEITPAFYYLKRIGYKDTLRRETTFRITNKIPLEKMEVEVFNVTQGGLSKISTENGLPTTKPYLSIESKECIGYHYDNELLNDIWATKICYLEKEEDLTIGEEIYKEAYVFKKFKGQIEIIVYYDSCLILLKEEYLSGFTTPFRIVRINYDDLNR